MSLDTNSITDILKKKSLRVTQSRLVVADVLLQNKDNFLTPDDIFQSILGQEKMSCDQASVYRTLATFEEIGIVQKSDFHKDASRYKINESFGEKKHHRHFFKCISCLTVEPFSDCFIHKKEKEMQDKGYRNLKHHLEITGLCPNCSH